MQAILSNNGFTRAVLTFSPGNTLTFNTHNAAFFTADNFIL